MFPLSFESCYKLVLFKNSTLPWMTDILMSHWKRHRIKLILKILLKTRKLFLSHIFLSIRKHTNFVKILQQTFKGLLKCYKYNV